MPAVRPSRRCARGSSAKRQGPRGRAHRQDVPATWELLGQGRRRGSRDVDLWQIDFTRVPPGAVSPYSLGPVEFDTVVLSQVCDIKTSVPDSFKRALVTWVGQGHKLIIHDSDLCADANTPDYSFLPYHFSTSNPGRKGAESKQLIFVEENSLGNSTQSPAFLDVGAWSRAGTNSATPTR